MSPSRHSKIKSTALIASVAILALVFGIMLDKQVVPETKKPLMTEEAVEQDNNKTAKSDTKEKQTAQEQAAVRKKKQTAQIKQLDQKADVTIEKADGIIAQTDEIISKAGLPQPEASKQSAPENKKIAKRLADARSRLDALKK